MTTEEFNLLVHNRTEKIRAVLATKAAEYARGDRLSNFKRAATILRVTPEQAWVGMFAKHLVSILDMVDDVQDRVGSDTNNLPLWDEKITDAINYLVLLEALVSERIRQDNETATALREAAAKISVHDRKKHR